MTSPGPYAALFDELPGDIADLAGVAQGLIIVFVIPCETEVLFPPGTQFEVTDVTYRCSATSIPSTNCACTRS
jgi:hypothetical protein